ncbi:PsbP-related protein [Methanobacterium sp.]|uniref:PsbP-related protein n=1 Tax=Methanobacterium sp. TaxID=2164 RepID=UPI003C752FD2
MVRCPNCGIEYDDGSIKCLVCGYNFKESPEENIKIQNVRVEENKSNIQAIFAGTLGFSGLMFFIAMLIVLLGMYHPLDSSTVVSAIIFAIIVPIIIGNILACWISNSNYLQSIFNGGMIGIIPVLVFSIFGLSNILVLFVFLIMGILGGILGKIITAKLIKKPQTNHMEKIRITLVFLFVITACIFGTSMAIAGASNNTTYDQNGISFSYFGELVVLNNAGNTHPFGTGNNLTVVAALNGVNGTGTQSDSLVISKGPAAMSLQDHVNAEKASIQKANCTVTSEANLTVDGVSAAEIDYNTTSNIAGVDLLLIKNNTLYDLNFNYGINNTLQRYVIFSMIEKSFHIK